MRGPRHNHDYPDRKIDCEFEIEPEFQALILRVEEVGWPAQEVYLAIISLCEKQAIGDLRNDAVEALIYKMRGRPNV